MNDGQISLLTLVPERGFAVAVLSNADRNSVLTRDVTERALKEYLDIERPKPIESTADDLAPYIGIYKRPFADLELGTLGARLIGQITTKQSFPTPDSPPPPPTSPFSLGRCEEDRLLVLDGPSWRFSTREDAPRLLCVSERSERRRHVIRKEDGAIGWIRSGGRIHVREE